MIILLFLLHPTAETCRRRSKESGDSGQPATFGQDGDRSTLEAEEDGDPDGWR